MTMVDGKINPGEPSTVAESRQNFHFEEFATSLESDLILVTEKKVVTPPALQACSKTGNESLGMRKKYT